MEDLTIDRDRRLLELGRERGESLDERLQQFVDARRGDYDPLSTVCVDCPSAWKVDCRHSVSPCSTRGGDSGSSVKRTPVADRIPLATAATGGTVRTPPPPRPPEGCRGFATPPVNVPDLRRTHAPGTRGAGQ